MNHVRRHQQSIDEVKKCYLQEYKENYEVVPDDPVVDVCLDDMRDITGKQHLVNSVGRSYFDFLQWLSTFILDIHLKLKPCRGLGAFVVFLFLSG